MHLFTSNDGYARLQYYVVQYSKKQLLHFLHKQFVALFDQILAFFRTKFSPQIHMYNTKICTHEMHLFTGNDGYAPLRYYVVQYSENNGPWIIQPEQVDPTFTAYTVRNLSPFTIYKFRIQAVNDIGPSGWSADSNLTKTLPSAPSSMYLPIRGQLIF